MCLLYIIYIARTEFVAISSVNLPKDLLLNTYWTRPSTTSSLLHKDNVIFGETKLSPIRFCTGAINWMLDEVKSNKCFNIRNKIGLNSTCQTYQLFVSYNS